MSAYIYLSDDHIVTGQPCKLLSVIVSNTGADNGKVIVYNARSAESGYEVAMLFCGANDAKQYGWQGLELSRGLFVEFVEKADFVTVEWEPVGYKPGQE